MLFTEQLSTIIMLFTEQLSIEKKFNVSAIIRVPGLGLNNGDSKTSKFKVEH